jgi:hypothetical protein
LCILRAEIKNKDFVVVNVCHNYYYWLNEDYILMKILDRYIIKTLFFYTITTSWEVAAKWPIPNKQPNNIITEECE